VLTKNDAGLMNLKKTCVAIAVLNMGIVDEIQAATFRVTSTIDQPGVCTVEAALAKVNGDPNPGLANCDSINGTALGTNDEILFNVGLINNISTTLEIKKSVKINPEGSTRVRFIGNESQRIFTIGTGTSSPTEPIEVTFNNVQISGGAAQRPNSDGGGILSDGANLTLLNSEVSGNKADNAAGIKIIDGNFTAKNSDIANNEAYGDAGGIGGINAHITIENSSVTGNLGAGIFINNGTFDINNVNVSDNSDDNYNLLGQGIVVFQSKGTIVNSLIENNKSVRGGAGVYVNGTCDVNPCVTISNSKIVGNSSRNEGGGIAINSGATLKLDSSTLSSNKTSRHGGGIFVDSNSKVEVFNTTISSNQADGSGGGVAQSGNSEVLLINSTVAANEAEKFGGGFFRFGFTGTPKLELLHTTVTANTAQEESGGISFLEGELKLANSIVAGNQAVTVPRGIEIRANWVTSVGVNLLGTSQNTFSQAFNIFGLLPSEHDITAVSDGNQPSSFSDIFGDSALANNGGATFTYSLAQNSPALDAADATECLRTNLQDQTGNPRPVSACDIGALETPGLDDNFIVIPLSGGKAVIVVL